MSEDKYESMQNLGMRKFRKNIEEKVFKRNLNKKSL